MMAGVVVRRRPADFHGAGDLRGTEIWHALRRRPQKEQFERLCVDYAMRWAMKRGPGAV